MSLTSLLAIGVPLLFTAAAAYLDLRYRRIPNWLTVSTFALGLTFHTVTSGLDGLGTAWAGFAAGFLPLLILWLIGGGGGGDVKLMAALGTWLGASVTIIVFLGSSVVALAMMVGLMTWRTVAKPVASGVGTESKSTAMKLEQSQRLIPYAVPVAVMAWGWLLTKFTLSILT